MTVQPTDFTSPPITRTPAAQRVHRAWGPPSRLHPAPPPEEGPVTVTVQVTLPARRDAQDTGDPMLAAARLAERLREVASSAGTDRAPVIDVSTTVAVVLGRSSEGSAPPGAERIPALGTAQWTGADRNDGLPRRTLPHDPARPPAPLRILTGRRDAVLAGTPLTLTRREYDLLLFLAGRPGRVFTRPQLLRWVWGQDIISGERTVDVHVRRLRTKLTRQGPTITTIRGIGYRLDDASRVDVVHS
jgi:hypothetical protein